MFSPLTRLLVAVWVAGLLMTGTASAGVTKDVAETMSDGVRLMTDEYVPDSGCPCPVVLNFNPYSKVQGNISTLPSADRTYLVEHGYAGIIVDARGTGGSEGRFGIFSGREQRDYAEMIATAARRPFANGHVAVMGD